MNIEIKIMNINDFQDVFLFEKRNRVFFEEGLPTRPSEYFDFDAFTGLMKEILKEQSNKECYMHVIRLEKNVIGRINFHSIVRKDDICRAELGYRIDKDFLKCGIATKSVQMITNLGFSEYGFTVIEAGTSKGNTGSQKVLNRNGYNIVREEKKVLQVNGVWLDGLLFEKVCVNLDSILI
jgi:ribosomal-protein-alanine N-acetyltransferase